MNQEPQTQALEPITTREPKPRVSIGERGIQISDLDGLWRFAQAVSKSGLAPKGIETPEAITVAIQMGLEIGLTPMAALQNIAVINGRPSLWGDSQLGVVRASGLLADFREWYEVGGKEIERNPQAFADDTCAVCAVHRKGYSLATFSFSVADAKRAGLWGKQGPWTQYPARMLRFRARSFILRDNFGDVLKGLLSSDEAADLPAVTVTTSAPVFSSATVLPPPVTTEAVREDRAKHRKTKEVAAAPITPAPEPAPVVVDPPQTATLQDGIRDFCTDAGVSFEDFKGWLKTTGRHTEPEVCEWAEVPSKVCEALKVDAAGLARLVKLYGTPKP